MSDTHFFDAIHRLRSSEEMLLLLKSTSISAGDAADTLLFLESEWDNERLEYPGTPPPFHPETALWAAKTIYIAAQLQLFREQNVEEALRLLPRFEALPDAGMMLSADLTLRMLPFIAMNLEGMNSTDPVAARLREILQQFHYAAVGFPSFPAVADFSIISGDRTLMQLYADRVISRQDRLAAGCPELAPWLDASMGAWKTYFWSE